jgi:hypothetical protein
LVDHDLDNHNQDPLGRRSRFSACSGRCGGFADGTAVVAAVRRGDRGGCRQHQADRPRAPAAAVVALVSGVPIGLALIATGSFRHVLALNAMAALLLIGSVGTLCTALYILRRDRRDPIARAVARSRPS